MRLIALDGGAAGAGDALVAGGEGGVHEVVAAGALQEVAAGGGHVAQLRGGSGEQRLREQRVLRATMIGWLARSELRTSAPMRDAAVGRGGDLGRGRGG